MSAQTEREKMAQEIAEGATAFRSAISISCRRDKQGEEMSETKIETVVVDSGDRDHEAPLIILGVFQQVISSDIGTARLREAGSLSPEGAEILEKIMWGGRSPLAATGSLNMIKTLGKVCGFAESRAKAALAKAVSMGLMNGGPLPS